MTYNIKEGLKDLFTILYVDETFPRDQLEGMSALDILNFLGRKWYITNSQYGKTVSQKPWETIHQALYDLTHNVNLNTNEVSMEKSIIARKTRRSEQLLYQGGNLTIFDTSAVLPDVYTPPSSSMVIGNSVFGGANGKNPKILWDPYSIAIAKLGFQKSAFEEIRIPYCISSVSKQGAFRDCKNLKLIELAQAMHPTLRTASEGFAGCENLQILVINHTQANISPTKPIADMFTDTYFDPDTGAGGIVYVPQKYLNAYQNATEWQTNANVVEFRTIEGSVFENKAIYTPFNWEEDGLQQAGK